MSTESSYEYSDEGENNSLIAYSFVEFDTNGDGFISQDELRPFAEFIFEEIFVPNPTEEMVNELMTVILGIADEDGDGKISYDEFEANCGAIQEYVATLDFDDEGTD
eukprot:TRINITY_DN6026_c0_g3_i1.p1 TRINITY_DN6026_c0_g3~~TRINITY_DN6026_c0_g3_i1.p1  ORF type:complete len:107 (-),score=33.52 TRINITY_DN6026_c0_g3_i1:43-363(-)